jgi:hypothetical protein
VAENYVVRKKTLGAAHHHPPGACRKKTRHWNNGMSVAETKPNADPITMKILQIGSHPWRNMEIYDL